MLVIGTFEHSLELEQLLAYLENNSISRSQILVVPMNIYPKSPTLLSKSHDLYYKGIEVGVASATACSVVGTSVGFILTLGPIFWGLMAGFIGFTIGFSFYILSKKGIGRRLPKTLPEIIIIVQCPEDKSTQVMEAMWKYPVLTVGRAQEPA